MTIACIIILIHDFNFFIADKTFVIGSVFMLLASIYMSLHFTRNRIILDEMDFIHESVFKTYFIQLKEITSVNVEEYLEVHAVTNQYQLVIKGNNFIDIIRFDSYKSKDLIKLTKHLQSHCKLAEFNLLAVEMASGKMPAKF